MRWLQQHLDRIGILSLGNQKEQTPDGEIYKLQLNREKPSKEFSPTRLYDRLGKMLYTERSLPDVNRITQHPQRDRSHWGVGSSAGDNNIPLGEGAAMHYRYATSFFAKRLDMSSHAVSGSILTSGLVTEKWELDLAAAAAWLLLQGLVFLMNVYAGPPSK